MTGGPHGILVPEVQFYRFLDHLLPARMIAEEAAFLFARASLEDEPLSFEVVDWYPVPPDGFASRSLYHLELSDETRAHVIKQAHDLGCGLIEAHSHAGRHPAEFSPSDHWGFTQFVPHALWRLKGRPYAAIVASRGSVDALAWRDAHRPLPVPEIVLRDSRTICTTGLSFRHLQRESESSDVP